MATLKDIIRKSNVLQLIGRKDAIINSLAIDSRNVDTGSLFFAIKGTAADGHNYIREAVKLGAVAIVCEQIPDDISPDVSYVLVANSQLECGNVSSLFYGEPSKELTLVGITGTNGKTTTATLLYDLFTSLGYKTGLLSTVCNRIGESKEPATHTTPDPISLNRMLAQMVAQGCEYCFMEVSSHSIDQHRIAGLHFKGGIFTNITHDHLDYHKTFAEYIRAKKMFFDDLGRNAFALINMDDRNGSVMVQNTQADIKTYSLRSSADFRCKIVEMHMEGMLLEISSHQLWTRLTGRFNAYNLTAVYACAVLLGADPGEVMEKLSGLGSVEGRFECVTNGSGPVVIVDYAHTPDALKNILETVNEIRGGNGKLVTVVGCGGDRDAAKRPVMARIAAEGSNLVILTSDNPRSEDPVAIIREMATGIDPGKPYLSITDRAEAIRTAAAMSATGDIILIAGKGHETYQDIAGAKNHFDDREQAALALESFHPQNNK